GSRRAARRRLEGREQTEGGGFVRCGRAHAQLPAEAARVGDALEKQRGLQPVVFVQRQLQRGVEGGPLADKLVVGPQRGQRGQGRGRRGRDGQMGVGPRADAETAGEQGLQDRKSTRLNSSHVKISYAVF